MNTSENPYTGFRCITPMRIRYGECDMQGILFNAHYLALADVGITEYFRAIAGSRSEEGGNFLADFIATYGGDNWVRHAEVDFLAPITADDRINICTRVTRFGNTSYNAEVRFVRGDKTGDTHCATITLTYVWFDPKTQGVIPVSKAFIAAVDAYEPIAPLRK